MFPDISEHNGSVDWNAIANAWSTGVIEGIAIRSSFGTVRADNQFIRNRDAARTIGIPRIYYHFCYPAYNSPSSEAAFANSIVGPLQSGEAMCGDFENDDSPGVLPWPLGAAAFDWAVTFLTALQSPQLATWWYCSTSFVNPHNFTGLANSWPWWEAAYGPTVDTLGLNPIAWQDTDCASVPGVSGCCDASIVFRKPLSQWTIPSVIPSPPPVIEEDTMYIFVIDTATVPSGVDWPGDWLLSGSLYTHIPDPPTFGNLTNAGVKTVTISYSMHLALIAARVKIAGSIGVSGTLSASS